MQKLPIFNSAKHEFTHFALMAMKNAMTVQAIENHLNLVTEAVNSLIDESSSVDLEGFKSTFLKELAALLDQKDEFEFSNSLFDLLGTERTDLKDNFDSLELQVQSLAERISKIESARGHEKVEETESSNSPDLSP
jgi:superfamily I DNA and/or RNA helicase